eukprot:gene5078-8678_t
MKEQTKQQIIKYTESGHLLEDILAIFSDEATTEEIVKLFHQCSNSDKKETILIEDDITTKSDSNVLFKNISPSIETKTLNNVVEPTKDEIITSINNIREEVEANCIFKGIENIRNGFQIGSKISKMYHSDKAEKIYDEIETHLFYYMKLQFEPKEIRAFLMKDFSLSPEKVDQIFSSIENTEQYRIYLQRHSIRRWYKNQYSSILSDPYYTSTPTKKKPMKKEKNDQSNPQKYDISIINDLSSIKGDIVWFKRNDFKSNINYQLYYTGKHSIYSTNFFLHQQNVKSILEASKSDSKPNYIKGKIIEAKQFTGGRRFGIGKEMSCVGIEVDFQ